VPQQTIVSDKWNLRSGRSDYHASGIFISPAVDLPERLAASLTKNASRQTYYTIRILVDRERVADAYRAYGYFRWVDDQLDGSALDDRIAFARRQQALVERGYQGERPQDLTKEEHLLFDLIRSDDAPDSGLQSYIRHLMAVMVFDAERRGCLITEHELNAYSMHLATAVTEALHYYIGHDDPSPQGESRCCAVTGAHITHMLRDTFEDVAAGYFNIPAEFLASHGIQPTDVESDAYREWVKSRVHLARAYFREGKAYLAQVSNWRCRIAGRCYMARFEAVLDAIEQADYRLQPLYPQRDNLRTMMRMGGSALMQLFAWVRFTWGVS
jgi:phytoene/squalene synthetase